MNYILMDIKNFLKKLETGQLEIEAGQWELHKDITNLKTSMQGLKQLKKDVQLMKQHGMTQTNLIKELQCKLMELEKIHNSRQWSCTSSSSQVFDKGVVNHERVPKVYFPFFVKMFYCVREDSLLILEIKPTALFQSRKKNKNHSKIVLRSGKVVGFSSKDPDRINKRQSGPGFKAKNEKEFFLGKETRQKGQGDSAQPYRKLNSQSSTQKLPKTPPTDHSILQRYLQDSARYIERETPRMSYISSQKSSQNLSPEQDFDVNCDSPKSKLNQQDQKKGEVSVKNRKISSIPKKFGCPLCPKKFAFKSTYLRHQRKHQAKPLYSCSVCNKCFLGKNRLKKHEKVHQKIPKRFRGFRCSYCDKICKTPEKLTEHLKSCRIIKKTHTRKKII